MTHKNAPVKEFSLGKLRAKVWMNVAPNSDRWFNVTIVRRYRADSGWQETSSFGRDDLPVVSAIASMAYAWIWDEGAEQTARQSQPESADCADSTPHPHA